MMRTPRDTHTTRAFKHTHTRDTHTTRHTPVDELWPEVLLDFI